jgi:hypothetical protein
MLTESIILTRKLFGNGAVYGHLTINTKNHGKFKFTTIENDEYKIQEGVYPFIYNLSPKFGYETILLQSTGDRSGIRIHPANRSNELSGCIGVGLYNVLDEIPTQIFNSRQSVEILESIIRLEKTPIQIIEKYENKNFIKISRKSTT